MKNQIYNRHLLETTHAINRVNPSLIQKAIDILYEVRKNQSTVYLFGNGGSHATASHMANDLFKASGIKAVCVSEMISTSLAFMNDLGPGAMFSAITREFAKKDDVLIAFSCSGDSENVVNALLIAPEGVHKILLTGHRLGKATKLADVVIGVDNTNIRIQESVHSAVCHAITESLITPEV
jgi:D-sedoheptulose 7-phosphate isomerase